MRKLGFKFQETIDNIIDYIFAIPTKTFLFVFMIMLVVYCFYKFIC